MIFLCPPISLGRKKPPNKTRNCQLNLRHSMVPAHDLRRSSALFFPRFPDKHFHFHFHFRFRFVFVFNLCVFGVFAQLGTASSSQLPPNNHNNHGKRPVSRPATKTGCRRWPDAQRDRGRERHRDYPDFGIFGCQTKVKTFAKKPARGA